MTLILKKEICQSSSVLRSDPIQEQELGLVLEGDPLGRAIEDQALAREDQEPDLQEVL